MARQSNLHLISKLRYDAALYFPYTGSYAGRGPRRKYGSKSPSEKSSWVV
jgi:putative transposase